MNFLADVVLKSSMEGLVTTDGVVPQPVVAVYVPSVDGEVNPLANMDVEGALIDYRDWQGHTSLEGMQQIDQINKHKVYAEALAYSEDSDIRDVTHVDYNLFVISPEIQPSWYDTLGEVKDVTGALLTGNLDEYDVKTIVKLTEALGMENIFNSVGKACVRIERVLHRQGVLKG
jgi:hypothetical protein